MKFEEYLVESEITDLEKELKGTPDYLKAPNGKKSNLPEKQWLIVRTKLFKNWFGDWETDKKNSSKVLDENGEPMIVYHGTNDDFDTFDKKKAGIGNDKGLRGKGFYMSPNKKTSMSYGSSLIEGFVNIRNPFIPEKFKSLTDIMSILDIEGSYEEDDFERMISFDDGNFRLYSSTSGNVTSMIKDAGFDGVLYIPKQEVIAFEPNQIKSINNKGSFGKTNNINENLMLKFTNILNEISMDETGIKKPSSASNRMIAMLSKRLDKSKHGELFENYKFIEENDTLFMIKDNEVVLIVAFENSGKYKTIANIIKHTTAERGVGLIAYEYIIHHYKYLISDKQQTSGARKVWIKLLNKHKNNAGVFDGQTFTKKTPDLDWVEDVYNSPVERLMIKK